MKDRKKRKPNKPKTSAPLPRVRRLPGSAKLGMAFIGIIFAALIGYVIWQYVSAAQEEKDAIEKARIDAGS